MPDTAPRIIIFDLGKVIVDFDHMAFCKGVEPFCAFSAEGVYERIFGSGLEKLFDLGKLSPEEFYESARSALSLSIDMEHFSRLWSDIFSLQPGIGAIIERLYRRFRLLCLSNTNPWHFSRCRRQFSALNSFDGFVLSYEEKCCKPDSGIFNAALRKAGVPARQCIFIDDIAENVHAARGLGFTSFIFTTVEGLARDLAGAGAL